MHLIARTCLQKSSRDTTTSAVLIIFIDAATSSPVHLDIVSARLPLEPHYDSLLEKQLRWPQVSPLLPSNDDATACAEQFMNAQNENLPCRSARRCSISCQPDCPSFRTLLAVRIIKVPREFYDAVVSRWRRKSVNELQQTFGSNKKQKRIARLAVTLATWSASTMAK